jgi:multiple sugar transport system ATP-binding protein
MDEPLSNLDAKLRAQTRIELIRLHRQLQKTVLYVTHDQIEAMTMGERIAVMDRGRLQQVGTANEVYAQPANLFVAQFIGTPAMTIFGGALVEHAGTMVVEADELRISLSVDQANIVRASGVEAVSVGVRPEHIDIASQFGERPAAATFDARIDVVESLGNEIHATLLMNARSIIARLEPDASVQVGQDERFAIAPEHLLLFDPKSGRRLG